MLSLLPLWNIFESKIAKAKDAISKLWDILAKSGVASPFELQWKNLRQNDVVVIWLFSMFPVSEVVILLRN